ncbi:MAG TPA: hypothetical protein PK668_03815 [Myxococcota bacterium]|nr:hypothetical protein [Myxococcota bacterium]HRY91984.1 hypothetical protein [Myxococcota bacterium]HSA21372.1 hypothetical protein [Myxococcota bacterium]
MIMTIVWVLVAAGLFTWNHLRGDEAFIGVRFTEHALGFPLNAGWLAIAVALYCLIRWLVRRKRSAQAGPPAGGA